MCGSRQDDPAYLSMQEAEVTLDARLTRRARNVLMCAGLEAERLGHNYVGTEHILLGLLREGEGIGAGVLEKMGVRLEQAREEVESIVGREKP